MQTAIKTQRPAKPLLGISLLIGGLYTALSLLSYSRTDPSFSYSANDLEALRNWGGVVGSYLADAVLQLLGIVGYFATIAAIFAGIKFLNPRSVLLLESAKQNLKSKWQLPTSLALLVLSLAGLLSLIPFKIYSQTSLGGALGFWLSKAATFCFSTVGATLFFVGGLWAGFYLLTGRVGFSVVAPTQELFNKLKIFILAQVSEFKSPFQKKEPSVHMNQLKPTVQKRLEDLFKSRASKSLENPETTLAKASAQPSPHLEESESKTQSVEETSSPAQAKPQLGLFNRSEPKVEVASKKVPFLREVTARKKAERENSPYEFPSFQLLDLAQESGFEISKDELIANSRALEQKLMDFGIQGHVTNIRPGPIITLYEFEPAPGVKVKNITNLTDDLKLAMKSVSIRILAPIPGKAAVGIEIPNPRRQTVYLREILQSPLFQNSPAPLTMGMGKTTSGDPYVTDLSKMPHLLIAGATGSGKSVGLNGIVVSMLYKASPEELKFIMIDPKMLELSVYEGIPHLLLPVVTDPKKAARALAWAVKEMERRYKLISSLGARNLKSFNEKVARLSQDELKKEMERAKHHEDTMSALMEDAESANKEAQEAALQEAGLDKYVKLPNIVIVIDELADLIMVAARDVEESIARLAQMARAAGIHLIIATQRPSVDVITGVIKANLPTRCAFQVASKVDSRTIIDTSGAENLIGEGDMLFLPPGTSRLERLHGPFISEDEIARVVRHLKTQAAPDYSSDINLEEAPDAEGVMNDGMDDDIDDALYDQALNVVFETKAPSASMLQRRLRIGYNRAARLVERMEREGIVSAPQSGGKGRELLVTPSHD